MQQQWANLRNILENAAARDTREEALRCAVVVIDLGRDAEEEEEEEEEE
jgi:hypothetical protein